MGRTGRRAYALAAHSRCTGRCHLNVVIPVTSRAPFLAPSDHVGRGADQGPPTPLDGAGGPTYSGTSRPSTTANASLVARHAYTVRLPTRHLAPTVAEIR